jgi:hypothetical protein
MIHCSNVGFAESGCNQIETHSDVPYGKGGDEEGWAGHVVILGCLEALQTGICLFRQVSKQETNLSYNVQTSYVLPLAAKAGNERGSVPRETVMTTSRYASNRLNIIHTPKSNTALPWMLLRRYEIPPDVKAPLLLRKCIIDREGKRLSCLYITITTYRRFLRGRFALIAHIGNNRCLVVHSVGFDRYIHSRHYAVMHEIVVDGSLAHERGLPLGGRNRIFANHPHM